MSHHVGDYRALQHTARESGKRGVHLEIYHRSFTLELDHTTTEITVNGRDYLLSTLRHQRQEQQEQR